MNSSRDAAFGIDDKLQSDILLDEQYPYSSFSGPSRSRCSRPCFEHLVRISGYVSESLGVINVGIGRLSQDMALYDPKEIESHLAPLGRAWEDP